MYQFPKPPEKPRVELSRDGYEFDAGASRWTLNKEVKINLDRVLERLAPSLRAGYRAVLTYYARNYSPAYCHGIHNGVREFLRLIDADGFCEPVLRSYRARLTAETEWRLGFIRPFLRRWHDLGYEGVSTEAVEYLASLKLRGNRKGAAVLSLDPDEGPYDDQELAAILDAAAQAYEQGRIDLPTLVFALLLAHTGRRPGQLSMLRAGDLEPTATSEHSGYAVRVPRSKQRGCTPRSRFKPVALPPDVFGALVLQRDALVERTETRLGTPPATVRAELPLFPRRGRLDRIGSVEELAAALRNDNLHASNSVLRAGLAKIEAWSARTGRRIRITPRRLRYTIATRASREGHGPLVIAEILDHNDVQHVGVYTRTHSNFRQKIDEAVGRQLAPLAAAYMGNVVDGEECARHGDDPSMRVGSRETKVGNCGSLGFCGAQAAACYTCIHFRPWVDAPHEKMLEWFLAARKRAADAGAGEHVVAATDRSILGARAVIAACDAKKAELAGDGS